MNVHNPKYQACVSSLLNDAQYIAGFGNRQAGNAQDLEKIESYFKKIGLANCSLVIPKQIHSNTITFIEDTFPVTYVPDTDGLITKKSNVVLIAKTADCVPIIFIDKKAGMIGISHQGWKGTLDGMAIAMIEAMQSFGSDKKDLLIAIGPSVGACCYEVLDNRYQMYREKYPNIYNELFEFRDNKIFLNLLKANYKMLLNAGIAKSQIDYFLSCTQCDEKFFSRRRDGEGYENMINFVVKQA